MIANISLFLLSHFNIVEGKQKLYFAIMIAIFFYIGLYFLINMTPYTKYQLNTFSLAFIDIGSLIYLNYTSDEPTSIFFANNKNKKENKIKIDKSVYDNKSVFENSFQNRKEEINNISIDITKKTNKTTDNENKPEIICKDNVCKINKNTLEEFPNEKNTNENEDKFVSEENGDLIEK